MVRILSVGNSFAVDTMKLLPQILLSLGETEFRLGCLYIGGCSIQQHYKNFTEESEEYLYYESCGGEWSQTPGYSIRKALAQKWDVISVQHGSKDGSWYTRTECYEKLGDLVRGIRNLGGAARIAFNMAWVPEPESGRREITAYNGDQLEMYRALVSATVSAVAPLVDVISPAGTAIQNARRVSDQKLTRDNFHLSYTLGRYIASLTFLKALCDVDIQKAAWRPEDITEDLAAMAKRAAESAVAHPFCLTEISI